MSAANSIVVAPLETTVAPDPYAVRAVHCRTLTPRRTLALRPLAHCDTCEMPMPGVSQLGIGIGDFQTFQKFTDPLPQHDKFLPLCGNAFVTGPHDEPYVMSEVLQDKGKRAEAVKAFRRIAAKGSPEEVEIADVSLMLAAMDIKKEADLVNECCDYHKRACAHFEEQKEQTDKALLYVAMLVSKRAEALNPPGSLNEPERSTDAPAARTSSRLVSCRLISRTCVRHTRRR